MLTVAIVAIDIVLAIALPIDMVEVDITLNSFPTNLLMLTVAVLAMLSNCKYTLIAVCAAVEVTDTDKVRNLAIFSAMLTTLLLKTLNVLKRASLSASVIVDVTDTLITRPL
jgi:hypothetical protein